ncbi:MAG: threonine-phosphate decarboxylase [Hyphomicrobiales bacterium]|nr:threonine-phosphate decarboxylase [Hyphomicrobiales bacterium]
MAGLDWTADERAFTYHGGALEVARRVAPQAPEPWIDLSTGVNPHAYPLPDLEAETWSRLPETGALAKLEAAAAQRYGAPAPNVVAGPGSQALIQALAHILRRGAAGALTPTYGGFAEAFTVAGARIAEVKRFEEMNGLDIAIVVNPNNPDGRAIPRGDLLGLHERLARRGSVLIVDEAFADFDPEESLAPSLPASGAVVLRSFGKTYGLAGLRLGFALASPDIAPSLRGALGPWPVSGPAIAIGIRALADSHWLEKMRARLGQDKARLDALLRDEGWRIIGGTRLFRLAEHGDAHAVFERLLAAGILARPFADERTWLRLGIPGDENAWERLAAALRS